MARTREFDTDEALDAMADQFWSAGFEATGIADLEAVTGLGRASLYGAFGSKKQMLYRSIDYYLDHRVEQMFSPVDGAGLAGVRLVFERFAMARRRRPERAQWGCLMVNSMVEFGSEDSGVVERGERYRTRIRQAFQSALEQAVADGEIEGPITERVDLATMLVLGMFVSIKSGADADEIDRLSQIAIDQVESWRLT